MSYILHIIITFEFASKESWKTLNTSEMFMGIYNFSCIF
jgi:hypothetical protein